MSTRKRKTLSLSSERPSLYVSSASSGRRRTRSVKRNVRNLIINIAKETKDKRVINRLAALAKRYTLYHRKEDLVNLESLLKSTYPNMQAGRSYSLTSEDKNGFINFLTQLAKNESPTSMTHEETLNRFLKR
jgi:hypothetical protein